MKLAGRRWPARIAVDRVPWEADMATPARIAFASEVGFDRETATTPPL